MTMEKFVLLMFIFCILGKVGCLQFSDYSRIYNVEAGKDANMTWNYILGKDETIERIYVGQEKGGQRQYLASQLYNQPTIYHSASKAKRYRDELLIKIDYLSKVEVILKRVTESADDRVKYFVKFLYTDDGDEDEEIKETELVVIKAPEIIPKENEYKYILEMNPFTLPCKAEGKPLPVIKWYKQDSQNVIKSGNQSVALELNLTRYESANYTCVASNIAGSARYTVSVTVQYPPTINRTASSSRVGTYLNNPNPVYLKCVADGEPPPKYKWNDLFNEVSQKSVLPLQELGKEFFGDYTCQASNRIGTPAQLIVDVYQIKRPAVVKIDVSQVTRRSAVVNIIIPSKPGDGSIKAIILSYRGNGVTTKVAVKHLGISKKKVEINKLIPYTLYELNVTVENEFFESEGQNETFKTKEDVPGPPSNLVLLPLSPNSMRVSWDPPIERNGEITEYLLKFYKVGDNFTNYNNNDLQTTTREIKDLYSYTEYSASVRARTRIGYGEWSEEEKQKTRAEAPGSPTNVKIEDSSISKVSRYQGIKVSWDPPVSQTKLTYYNISVSCISKEDNKKWPSVVVVADIWDDLRRTRSISKIEPYSKCSVRVREGAGEPPTWGDYSSPFEHEMRESAPEKPKGLVESSISHDHVQLIWHRPDRINGVLQKYVIIFENSTGTYRNEMDKDVKNQTYYFKLSYLNQNTKYKISIVAHSERFESLPITLKIQTGTRPNVHAVVMKEEEGNAGPVIGGVFTVIFILVLAAGILLYIVRKKKRFDRANSANSDVGFFQKGENGHIHMVDGPMNSPVMKSAFMSDYVKNAQCTFTPKNPIPITSLKDYVQKYHTSKAKSFIDEFRAIKCDKVGSLDISSRAENKCKNRYANILAYDHSRVVLNTVEDLEGSDYVNANYIDGYNKKAKFIATQGPVVAAFNDFWRMIWEQDADKIIMVTNLVEKSRIKCQKYWPCESEKGVLYGNIKVQMIEELPLAEYVVRRFSITQVKDNVEIASRTVTQYQFLSWPDHGVPIYPTALLQFVKRVRALDQGTSGPIVCHCSAGVGRTGTYMALDAMLDQIENEKTVDVLGYITHIRGQRQLMVQTEAQYIFIYDTLLEAVSCGNTEVNTVDLFARMKHLDSINPGTTRTYMQEEFERVSFNIDDTNQYEAALLPCNVPKNRYPTVLPYELTRVKLWPYANIEGSDYINASFVDGYQQREAYILTQSPLENSVEEFWRMLWEYEIYTIVMISSPTERSKHHCYPYWPLNSEPTLFGILAVQLAAEEEKVGFIRREFRVTNSKNGESRTISHFMYFNWPVEGSPDTASAIEMIGQVQKTQQQTGNSAIVIHCSDGSGRSGSLAALMYCLERLKLEGLVDVFQTVRSMRTQRVGLVQSLEQYHFIYMAVSNFLDCFSNYANFK